MATKLKQQAIDTTQIMPIGAIMPYAGATAPSQFLLCQGQAISRTTYSALFAVIGTTYGAGNGSTTFNLPSLGGKIPVGQSTETEFNTLGKTGGAKTHTLSVDEMPSHNHQLGIALGSSGGTYGLVDSANSGSSGSTRNTNNRGGGLAHNNLQPYLTINYIIRY